MTYFVLNLLVPEFTTVLLSLLSTTVPIVLGHVLIKWTEEPAMVRYGAISTHVVIVVVAYLWHCNKTKTLRVTFKNCKFQLKNTIVASKKFCFHFKRVQHGIIDYSAMLILFPAFYVFWINCLANRRGVVWECKCS